MGILDKLSEMRRRVDEDWRDSAREWKKSKEVKPFHEDRRKALDFKIETKQGDFDIRIKPDASTWYQDSNERTQIEVYKDDRYITSEWAKDLEQLKKMLFDGVLTDRIFSKLKSDLSYNMTHANGGKGLSRQEFKQKVQELEKDMDSLDAKLELQLDWDDLKKKIHRYVNYARAMGNRYSRRNSLRGKAEREFREEHKYEVGDIVYGNHWSELRDGKEYKVIKVYNDGGLKVAPENGRGKEYIVYPNDVYLAPEAVNSAVENPDDKQYDKKFDQQEYMMNRYSNADDTEFNEAVKTLEDVGMIVEKAE
jgi:hypothetical protein